MTGGESLSAMGGAFSGAVEVSTRMKDVSARRFSISIAALVLAVTAARTPVLADPLTGQMARFNHLIGQTWACTTSVPAFGGRAAHTDQSTVSFSSVPGNVVRYHITGSDYDGDFYNGYDARTNEYWETGADSLGTHLFLTSADGENYTGTSFLGSIAMHDTIVRTEVSPDKTVVHEVLSGNGHETAFEYVCADELAPSR